MARKKVTVDDEHVVVLVFRDKTGLKHIDIPVHKVKVNVEVTTTATLTETVFKRLRKTARKELKKYEKTITDEAAFLDDKIAKLMKQRSGKREAKRRIKVTNVMIKQAMDSAEDAANEAMEALLRIEARNDQLLRDARVKTTFRVTGGFFKMGKSGLKISAASGVPLLAGAKIGFEAAKIGFELYKLCDEIHQQFKKEPALRQQGFGRPY